MKRPPLGLIRAGFVAVVAALFAAIGWHAVLWLDERHPPPMPADRQTGAVVLDRNGALLRPYTVEDGIWRLSITVDEADPLFIDMLLAYEDKRFYSHRGIDPRAMTRAAFQFATNRKIVSGGSTITMQLARLLEPRERRSLGAKLRQMARAWQIERRLSKNEILAAYLTLAPYGGNLEGLRAATLAYFGKEPRRLRTDEAALLVALPQSPEARRPDRGTANARTARDRVLSRMARENVISATDAERAIARPLAAFRRPFPVYAAHLSDRLIQTRPETLTHATTIDRDRQDALEQVALDAARTLGPKQSVAIMLVDHMTGEILARVGSPDYLDPDRAGAVDMTRAVRSPGSALKPFIYALAFESGMAHPDTLVEDRPISVAGYRPANFDREHQGTVSMREALQWSLNIPAVLLLNAVGPAHLVSRLRRAAVDLRFPDGAVPGLAIGLGGVGITLAELVALYSALPGSGTAKPLYDSPAERTDNGGATLTTPAAAWQVSNILSHAAPPAHGRPGRVAFKTGTSYGYRDAWAIGFDGRYVIGVWVGRADGTPIPGQTGISAAAPILFQGFSRLGEDRYPLSPAPRDVWLGDSDNLPTGLKRFTPPGMLIASGDPVEGPPQIVHPPADARVDIGLTTTGRARPLILKIEGGALPFRWIADGRPAAGAERTRTMTWQPGGPGFSTLTVIDALGRTDSVTLALE